jgi:hypothetical protein
MVSTKAEFRFGQVFTFTGVVDAAIQLIDQYSRWEVLSSLQHVLPFLANPATPLVLLVLGLILIQRSMQQTLEKSILDGQTADLRDEHGQKVLPKVRVPNIKQTLAVIIVALIVAGGILLIKIGTYKPVLASLTPRVVVPIEKTRPAIPPAQSTRHDRPTIEQRSYGPNSPNVNNSHDLQFNYNAEPPTRLLTEPQQRQLVDSLTKTSPAPFWYITETDVRMPPPETKDEQGLFTQQLVGLLTKAGWKDMVACCHIQVMTRWRFPLYENVTHRGVTITVPNNLYNSGSGLATALQKLGNRVMLTTNPADLPDGTKLDLIVLDIGMQ